MVLFQKCVRQFGPSTMMAPTAELWEFPIGFYVNLSSAVGAILVEGSKCWTHFWKRTIQLKIEKGG
jgi:hypothetical protein